MTTAFYFFNGTLTFLLKINFHEGNKMFFTENYNERLILLEEEQTTN